MLSEACALDIPSERIEGKVELESICVFMGEGEKRGPIYRCVYEGVGTNAKPGFGFEFTISVPEEKSVHE